MLAKWWPIANHFTIGIEFEVRRHSVHTHGVFGVRIRDAEGMVDSIDVRDRQPNDYEHL